MNADKDFDSVKTHPDCYKRFEKITGIKGDTVTTCCSTISNFYFPYKQRAFAEIVRFFYENNMLTYTIHFSIFAKQNGYNKEFYNNMLSLAFSKMYENDKNLKRFSSVNVEAKRETTLKELQDFLFALNVEDIELLANYFIANNTSAQQEDIAFAKAMFQKSIKGKPKEEVEEAYKNQYPKSKYNYLISTINTKK